ncbi:MAG: PilZ domain-containing protein [Planctomycetota bacterium]|jgi:c-di-GMP-binding flagellar brake protein YcgR
MENQGQPADSRRTGTAERRRHVRFLDQVKVRYRDIEGTDPSNWGRSRDLSLGGMGLLTERPLPVGSHLALEIHIETEPAPVLALARVVRCAQDGPERVTAGVEFLWMSAEDRGNLERLADYFRKKHGTSGDLQHPEDA